MNTRSIEIRLENKSYDCFIQDGNIVTIHKEVPLQASVPLGIAKARYLYSVPRLSGLWLRIAALLAEKGELDGR